MVVGKWGAIVLVVVLVSFGYLRHSDEVAHVETNGHNEISNNPNQLQEFDQFYVHDGVVTNVIDGTIILADQIVRRTRRSESLIYYNLKEIFMGNMRLKVLASRDKPAQLLPTTSAFLPLTLDDQDKKSSDGNNERKHQDDILTRIVAEDVNIEIAYEHGRKAVITSSFATMNIQDKNIVFEDDVVFIDANGRCLKALQGIWSNKFNGMLFPQGYMEQIKGAYSNHGIAFFQLNKSGKSIEVSPVPTIKMHQDIADQLENLVWSHMMKYLFPGFQ